MTALSDYHKYYNKAATDAEQWHVKSGKLALTRGGLVAGNAYTPALMEFDGSTGYFTGASITTSGTKITLVARFSASPVTATQVIQYAFHTGSAQAPYLLGIVASNDANNPNKVRFRCQNASGTSLCDIYSTTSVTDGSIYSVFAEYDADAGTAKLYINAADDENASATGRVAPITGTIPVGSSTLAVGATHAGAAPFGGSIGYAGVRFVGGLTPSDFSRTDGSPMPLDESTWTEWGAQPLAWNPHGDMRDNRGSAANFTQNGTIYVGDGGAT